MRGEKKINKKNKEINKESSGNLSKTPYIRNKIIPNKFRTQDY